MAVPPWQGGIPEPEASWGYFSSASCRPLAKDSHSLALTGTLHKNRDGNETLQGYSSNRWMHQLTRLWKRHPLT